MARLKTTIELEQERQELAKYVHGNYVMDKTRFLLPYARQSTDKQYFKSMMDKTEQSSELLEHAKMLDWPLDKILPVFVENDGNKRKTSGTISIDDRPKIKEARALINAGKVSAVLVIDVSRLFRDEDLIDPAVFAKECKRNHCIIITLDYVYDFNSPTRDDLRKFIQDCLVAGEFIKKHIKGKMLKARSKIADNGNLANGVAPVGLMRIQEEILIAGKKGHIDHLAPSPHAGRVDWLYARFRAHNASLSGLLREVLDMARRGEPLFPDVAGIDYLYLTRMLGGWTVTSRYGLRHILSNPVYAGHLVFNGRVVKRDAHPAIVDPVNWQYAFDHLADVDLDGQPLERPEKTTRYVQRGSRDSGALLAGTRHNGTPVIDGVDGAHVYVELPLNIYALKQLHRLKSSEPTTGYETSITTPELDHIFEKHLLKWLETAEYLSCLGSTIDELDISIHELAYDVDATEPTSKPPDDTLETLDSRIALLESDLHNFEHVMDATDRGYAYEQLSRLRKRRKDWLQAQQQQERIQAEIKQASSDVCLACSQWHSWDLERKRHLIRLVTDSITLEEIGEGWLRLTISWSPVLGGLTEYCYIWRATGSQWSRADVERLSELYPTASKGELLQEFPTRSWHAIQRRAIVSKVRRAVIDRDVTIPLDTSLSDYEVVQRYGIEPGKRVQWLHGGVSNAVFPS